MVVPGRLLRIAVALTAGCVLSVACSTGPTAPVASSDGKVAESLNICPMLDSESSDEDCGPYSIVSLIEPGPLNDRARKADVVHGLDADPVDGGRTFSGSDHDVVVSNIAPGESDLFNPAGGRFVFQAWLTLNRDQIAILRETMQPSWNVVQRGFADSDGGQWKLSLVTIEDAVAAQCVVRDGSGGLLRAHSRYRFEPGVEAAITCLFDDSADVLRVVVNEHTGDVDEATEDAPLSNVAPHDDGGDCWAAVADQLTIGNKPVCGTSSLRDDDRFQGVVRQVRILSSA